MNLKAICDKTSKRQYQADKFRNDIAFSFLRRSLHRRLCRIQHILDKYSVTRGGIIDHHVRDRAHVLTVLDYGATAHECGQEGTTNFNSSFMRFFVLG